MTVTPIIRLLDSYVGLLYPDCNADQELSVDSEGIYHLTIAPAGTCPYYRRRIV